MKLQLPEPRPKVLRGLFLGRFQPFHKGHLKVIKKALTIVDELIVVIGSAQESHTKENPFTADEREEMIERTLREDCIGNIQIIPLEDLNNDNQYVPYVQKFVPLFHVVFAAENQKTAKLFSQREYPVWTCKRIMPFESSEIRKKILRNDPSWRKLIPPPTLKIFDAVEGKNRITGIQNPR